MAGIKKCTDIDISKLLETNSNTDTDEISEYNESRENENVSDSSDSERIFYNKKLLLQKNALQKEQVSLRLKLRRSTEQSNYKIDSDSDNDRPKRLTRSTTRHLKRLQDENKIPQKGKRTIKLPKRYSDYDWFSPKWRSPVLQREQINYNEKELFLASLDHKNKTEIETNIIKNDDKSDISDCSCVAFIPKTKSTKSSTILKSNEHNEVSVNEKINNDKIIETKSHTLKQINKVESNRNNSNQKLFSEKAGNIETKTIEHTLPDNSPKKRSMEPIYNSFESTPKKSTKNRNYIARNILKFSDKFESTVDEYNGKKNVDIDIIQESMEDITIHNERNKDVKIHNDTEAIMQNNISTPKSRKPLKYNTLTPSVKMRTEALIKPVTPTQVARLRLHVSAVPKSLPCREEEFNNIYTFLESKLMDKRGGCIYISGVPGTGKTATVNEVVKCLKRSVKKGKLDQFNFVEINGMKLSEPRQAYVQILKQLTDNVLTWEQAYNALERRFSNNVKKPMTLLLVDELDLLCTKRQDVIYNILDWPAKISARLVVITIANTMDLPERILMGRVTSRLGLTRVSFQPYKHEQLQEIIISRLKDTKLYKSEAIQLIARKVSAVSGDARRALDICRRVAEITEARNGDTVSMKDVNQALSEMIANPKIRAIQCCSKMEQIFLQAVCTEITRVGIEEVCFKNVYKQFESLCSFDGLRTPNITETFGICARLDNSRLIVCENASNDIHQRILLNISKDDVYYALQADFK